MNFYRKVTIGGFKVNHIEKISGITAAILAFIASKGINVFPVILIIGLMGILYYINGGNLSKTNLTSVFDDRKTTEVTFADIGGQDVAINELCEALEFIKNSEEMKKLGIRPLKGILLSGPPGTGKTLLAKAAAQYTDSIFFAASGSEFVEMYVGVGAKRVRQLFNQAKKKSKKLNKNSAVIFIDEIEILGGIRGQGQSSQEHDQTLNELLTQMDGISNHSNVKILVIGATNRSDVMDPALLRPGRFDRIVNVDLPGKNGRAKILEIHTKNKPLDVDVSIETLAKDTFGFSGAQLESIANEAAIMAMREGAEKITSIHFKNAIEKVIMGEKLDRIPNEVEKQRIAIHESGHALVSELKFPNSVASVNVASRSNALGYVRQTQKEDIYLYTYDYLEGKIAVALAGVLAEEVLLNNRSTGGTSDFSHAGNLAKQIVFNGMSKMGIVSAEDIPKDALHSTISGILSEIENKTRDLLSKYKWLLENIVEKLLDKESLSGDELRELLELN